MRLSLRVPYEVVTTSELPVTPPELYEASFTRAHELSPLFDAGATLTLKDGRNLGYIVVGDLNSDKVVVLCSGNPGSRLEARVHGNSAFAAGVRLVCVDRQGVGFSDPVKSGQASLKQFADDVGELLDHLHVQCCSVVGCATGGPSALALAKYDSRVRKAALLASVAPLAVFGTADMPIGARFVFFLSKRAPGLLTLFMNRTKRLNRIKAVSDPSHLDRLIKEFSESGQWQGADKEYIDCVDWIKRRLFMVSTLEAYRQGARGNAEYGQLITEQWGFLLATINTPVHIYHGVDDDLVPIQMSKYLESRLPQSTSHYIRGQGHLSLIVRYMGHALKDISYDLGQ